jgi:hypothetical protein
MPSRGWAGALVGAVLLLGLASGCSTSGRELPAPTTTKPSVPQIVATVTTR